MATYSNNLEGLWSLARHKLRDFSLENQPFALGVSGGADSIGLFHVFSDFLKKNIISDLVIFHINFGLRGAESDADERFVRALCESKSVKLEVHRPSRPIDSSIQEMARDLRIEIQEKFLREGFLVSLAHNSDDVCETILMRLCRGTSLELAAGMSYFNGQIFRPWLDVSRESIRTALSGAHLAWREDSSNASGLYTRNRIRNEVMPILNELFPGAGARISRTFLVEFPRISAREQGANQQTLLLSVLRQDTKRNLDNSLHEWLTDRYHGKSPVSRQVIEKISEAILAVMGGVDSETREFHLPLGRILRLTRSELTLSSRN